MRKLPHSLRKLYSFSEGINDPRKLIVQHQEDELKLESKEQSVRSWYVSTRASDETHIHSRVNIDSVIIVITNEIKGSRRIWRSNSYNSSTV